MLGWLQFSDNTSDILSSSSCVSFCHGHITHRSLALASIQSSYLNRPQIDTLYNEKDFWSFRLSRRTCLVYNPHIWTFRGSAWNEIYRKLIHSKSWANRKKSLTICSWELFDSDLPMDSDFWTSRLAAAKRQYALQHQQNSQLGSVLIIWVFDYC